MIRVRLLVGLFFICQLLFSQSSFEGLTDDQKKSFEDRKLFLAISEENEYSWTVFEGNKALKEAEIYKMLDMDFLYAKSIKRDRKVRKRFVGGLAMLVASLYMVFHYNDLIISVDGNTSGYDCPIDSDYCYKTEWPYRMYGYGLGVYSAYSLYFSYFNSSFYKRLASSNELEESIKKYNLMLFKEIVRGRI